MSAALEEPADPIAEDNVGDYHGKGRDNVQAGQLKSSRQWPARARPKRLVLYFGDFVDSGSSAREFFDLDVGCVCLGQTFCRTA